MKISLIIIKFLFIGALFIIASQHLYLSVADDRTTFLNSFYDWLSNLFDNSWQIVGYVAKSEWLPQNSTVPGK